MFGASDVLTATYMECSHSINIDPPKLCNPLVMNESVAVVPFIPFAMVRPICMQLAC